MCVSCGGSPVTVRSTHLRCCLRVRAHREICPQHFTMLQGMSTDQLGYEGAWTVEVQRLPFLVQAFASPFTKQRAELYF